MAQKLWRVVRACVELGPKNPIQQIHDQGAGGNCNVVRPCLLGAVGAQRAIHLSLTCVVLASGVTPATRAPNRVARPVRDRISRLSSMAK